MSPTIITRAEIGFSAPTARLLMKRSDGAHIHYNGPAVPAAVLAAADAAVVRQFLRGIQQFHMGPARGWADFAYSFAVDGAGRLYEGRGWGVVGAHTPGFNSTSHALYLLLGEGQEPSEAMLAASRDWIAEHNRRYGAGYIRPHRAAKATACPGDRVVALINQGAFNPGAPAAPAPAPAAPAPIDLAELRRWIAAVTANNLRGIGVLKAGSTGGAVRALQDGLNIATGSTLQADGDFGAATKARVVDFQRFFKLAADGVVGPKTRDMLVLVLGQIAAGKG